MLASFYSIQKCIKEVGEKINEKKKRRKPHRSSLYFLHENNNNDYSREKDRYKKVHYCETKRQAFFAQ